MDRREVACLLSLATGRLLWDWREFHKWCEKRLGRPIMTHEFAASPPTCQELRNSITEEEWRQIYEWFRECFK